MRPTDVIQRSPRRVFNSERLGARNRSVLVPSNEPDAARTAPGPPWSAVEYTSTHPLDVRLRRALHDGNEVVSRCGTPELNVSTSACNCLRCRNLAVGSRNVLAGDRAQAVALSREAYGELSAAACQVPDGGFRKHRSRAS
jgi:hypothetical protein